MISVIQSLYQENHFSNPYFPNPMLDRVYQRHKSNLEKSKNPNSKALNRKHY
jgi:hypothetical protein